jgi:hypothetical protein
VVAQCRGSRTSTAHCGSPRARSSASTGFLTRGAIARLADDRLWVWSLIRLDADLRSEVDRLGQVAHLVSPNKLHHLYLAEWKSAYPEAKLWGPESTLRRRRELAFAEPLKDSPPTEWGPDFDHGWFRGSFAMDEIMFYHRPSRAVLAADLIQAFDDRFLHDNWSWWRRPLARLDESPPPIPARRANGGCPSPTGQQRVRRETKR